MASNQPRQNLLSPGGRAKAVTPVELFFDLVFVFAIAQLSHALLGDLSIAGALRTTLLFIAVWWVWMYTTWVTNWLSTERTTVRLMLFGLMLLGLVLSMSIPSAYGNRGLHFAIAYVSIQLGRSLFMLWALAGSNSANFRNFVRITIWLALSALLWIAGGLAEPELRWVLWTIALAIDFLAPMTGFFVPGMGRSASEDWNVSGEHMAERCGLFVIIALGEVIMMAGATYAESAWHAPESVVFAASVIAAIAMWWIYFNIGAERAAHAFARSDNPGRIARIAYTYIHVPIVCGIVATAAAIELLLGHPSGHLGGNVVAVVTGAMGLFLLGELLFKKVTAGWYPLSHLAGLVAVIVLAVFAHKLEPTGLAIAATVILVIVATWETVSLRNANSAHSA